MFVVLVSVGIYHLSYVCLCVVGIGEEETNGALSPSVPVGVRERERFVFRVNRWRKCGIQINVEHKGYDFGLALPL